MSRSIFKIPMNRKSVEEVLCIIEEILQPAGYSEKIVDGESIWVKGDGVVIKMQCLTAVFTDDTVFIQGWTKDALLGEAALDKMRVQFPKKNLKALIDDIQYAILMEEI